MVKIFSSRFITILKDNQDSQRTTRDNNNVHIEDSDSAKRIWLAQHD